MINHFLPCLLVPSPPFPGQERARGPLERFPEPERAPLCLEIVPPLIAFQDEGAPRGFGLCIIGWGHVPEPGEHSLRRDPEEKGDAVHGPPTPVPQDRVHLRGAGLAAWGRAGTLRATLRALLLGLAGRSAMADDAVTVTFGACLPQCSPPAGVLRQLQEAHHSHPMNTPSLFG